MDKPRLTDEECLRIENGLRERRTPYAIAKALGRPVRTAVREIRARRDPSGKGAFGHLTNRCLLRKGRSVEHKVATQCRRGRTYADSQLFLADNPGCPVTEMDTVEGTKGAKVLLALQFMPWRFMPAFLLERKCSAAVRRRLRPRGRARPLPTPLPLHPHRQRNRVLRPSPHRDRPRRRPPRPPLQLRPVQVLAEGPRRAQP